jgi:ABC-type transport system substrate-binding protein
MDRPIFKPAIGTDDDILYGYDLDKAKQLIAESNYPDGFKVSISMGNGVGLGAEWEALGLVLQSDLAKIGITVSLEQYDWSAMDEKAVEGNYEALLGWAGPYFADTAGHITDYLPGAYYLGKTGWENAEATRLADEAMKEPNVDKRYELYRNLSELYAEEAPVAFIAQEVKNIAFRSDIYGWDGNPDAYQCDYAVLYRKK